VESGRRFVSQPIRLDLGSKGLKFGQARIKLRGIEQAGSSFEGRLFLNNPAADVHTALTAENGYAGSFHVYGYGIWPGDVGQRTSKRSVKPGATRAPIEKTVIATDAMRAAATQGLDVTVTVVLVYRGSPPRPAPEALKLDGVDIVIE
jgi:hypothetical protein